MPTYIPPQKNVEYILYIGLFSQADTKLLKANPTIAAGDFKVSTDGGAFANLATLPVVTPAAGTAVKITLSTTEMNGDNIVVTCIDAAGAEWCDLIINIQTSAQSLDTMDTNIDAITAAGPTKAEMDTAHALLATVAKQDTIDTVVDGIQTDLSNATDGLGALKALIDTLDGVADAIKAVTDNLPNSGALSDLATIKGYTDLIDDATNGLTAIKAEVEGLAGAAMRGTENAALASVCTEARLAELAAANLPADVDTLKTYCDILDHATNGLANIKTLIDTIDTVVDAVKAKTDNLPSGIAKNVALSNFEFLMVLSSDHISPATGKTITAQISKDGGAFANCTNAVSEVSNGVYKINLTQTEMNADIIVLKFTEASCDQRTITIVTS